MTSFTGSTVTQVSPGMLQYKHVCVTSQPTVVHTAKHGVKRATQLRLLAFTPDAVPLRIDDVYDAYRPHPGNYEIFVRTEARPVADYYAVATTEGGFLQEPTLFTLQLHHNPGHCLSDMMFSIAWDAYARNITSPYDRYAYGQWNALRRSAYRPDWCFEMLRHAGYLRAPDVDMVVPSGHNNAQNQVCFETLYMPIFGLHRFPLDPSDTASVQAFRQVSVMEHFLTHNFTQPALQYPVGALERLRSSLCQSLDMPCSPWEDDATKPADAPPPVTILLYNRKGSPRRHWVNANAVQRRLEQHYHVQVTVVGEEWETMDPAQQLRLYNTHAYILTVHGAHEANLMAARPGTRVMEVQCMHPGDPRPNVALTEQPADDPVGWYGPPSWFSAFSRRLGAEHFVYGEYEGCTNGGLRRGPIHQSTEVRVEMDTFVPFVANRFGLTPRKVS